MIANTSTVPRSKIENQCFLRVRRRNVGENENRTSNKVHWVGVSGELYDSHNPEAVRFKSHLRNQEKEQTPNRVSVLFLASEAGFELAIYDCDPTSVARWVSKAQMIEYHLCFAVSPKARAGRAECKRSVEAIDRDTRRRLGDGSRDFCFRAAKPPKARR